MMHRIFLAYLVALLALAGCTYPTTTEEDDTTMQPQPFTGKIKTWAQSGALVTNGDKAVTLQTGDLSTTGYSVFTVKFGVKPPENGDGFNATALVTFMVNGNPIFRKVSVATGVEISGPADAITVKVVDTTPTAYANANQNYEVTIQCCPGTRSSALYPTLDDVAVGGTGTYVLPITGATVSIPIPQDVGCIGAWVAAQSNSASGLNPTTSIVEQSSGVTTNLYLTGLTDPMVHFIPIAPGAINLVCGNRDSVNINTLSVLWIIDG